MDSESKASAWVANLREQFSNFCSEADAIIPQEPIEYVRNQFLTVGDSLKQFYSELVEGPLPIFSLVCREDLDPIIPRKEENIESPLHKVPNINIIDGDQEGRVSVTNICEDSLLKEKGDVGTGLVVVENRELESSEASILAAFPVLDGDGNDDVGRLTTEEVDCDAQVNSSNTLVQCSVMMEYPEETEGVGNFEEARFAASKVKECELPESLYLNRLPCSGMSERIQVRGALNSSIVFTDLGGISTQPSKWQKLDESLTTIDSEDDLCSDSSMEADHEGKTPLLTEKVTKYRSEGFDEEKEAEEWESLDKDVCDFDWEIV